MDKEVKCPWCGETTMPGISRSNSDNGHIVERKCSRCGKVIAAYFEEEENFLPGIRTF